MNKLLNRIKITVPYYLAAFMYRLPTKKYKTEKVLNDAMGLVTECGKTIKYGPEWKSLWLWGKIK